MVTSVHLADVGLSTALSLLRIRLTPDQIPGLRYAESLTAAPLSAHLLPAPRPGRIGLIAAWENDAALEWEEEVERYDRRRSAMEVTR